MTRLAKSKVEIEGRTYERAVVVEDPEPPPWPADAQLRVVGRGEPRVDGPERVSGRATYTFDVQLPGMLYARILRSPHPHARIRRLDASRAEELPGVRAVISHLSAPQIDWSNGRPVLDRIVRFVGEEVAAVAADDPDIAVEALDLIEVEYDVLPFVVDAEAALDPESPKVHPGGNLAGGGPRISERGDVERAFADAEVIVEATFRTQPALHNCLETHGAVAAWDGDRLTVWESTQYVHGVRETLAQALDLPPQNVRVICEYMGGGFGSKGHTGRWSILAALLARQSGRPVHLMLSRDEENLGTGNRHPTVQRLKIGAMRDGSLVAIDLVATVAIGAYGWGAAEIEGPAQSLYACPNVRTEVRSVFTNTGPSSAFRAPGYVEGAFPLESVMDEIAIQVGLDPLEIRLRNYAIADPASGQPYSAKHLDECYRKGAEMIGWRSDRPVKRSGTKRRALGMASQIWGGGGGPPAYAWVRLNPDGAAEVILGCQDIGTGTRTAFAQIAAEELGLPLDQVTVRMGDSATGPYGPASWGSQTVASVGPAVRQAAADAREQYRAVVAGLLDVPTDQVEVRDGSIHVRGESSPRLRVGDVAGRVDEFTILGKGARGPNPPGVDLRTFGAQFAEVEVDILTGDVRVLRIVAVHDFGRVVNPLGAGSQIEGGVIQGVGYALTEGRVVDERTGDVLNPNLEDYLVPTSLDAPAIDHATIDRPDERANSLGAKGLGEPPIIPTAPAIANAIARAIGVRFLSLPIDRAKVLAGLRAAADARGVEPSEEATE